MPEKLRELLLFKEVLTGEKEPEVFSALRTFMVGESHRILEV